MDKLNIAILAPIAAGKSTLTALIAEYTGSHLITEKAIENPFLPLFYKNAKKYGYCSQFSFFGSAFLDAEQTKHLPKRVFDSCCLGNLVFVELMTMQGILTPAEATALKIFAEKQFDILGHPDKYVVLKRPKEKLFANQRLRNRNIEKGQEDYLNFHYDKYYGVLEHLIDIWGIRDRIIYLDLGEEFHTMDTIHTLVDQIIGGDDNE